MIEKKVIYHKMFIYAEQKRINKDLAMMLFYKSTNKNILLKTRLILNYLLLKFHKYLVRSEKNKKAIIKNSLNIRLNKDKSCSYDMI